MENYPNTNARLLTVAGFDVQKWDVGMIEWMAKELRSVTPRWVTKLAIQTGWRWPFALAGVRVRQSFGDRLRQVVEIRGPHTKLRVDGLVIG